MNILKCVGGSILISFANLSFSQTSFTYGKNSLEIAGLLTTNYNYRFQQVGNVDYKKNRFQLSNARLKLEGRMGNSYEYEVQLDLSRLGTNDELGENPAMLDANITIKKLPFNIIIGYQKLPYSRYSLTPFQYQPYWQRPEIDRGYIYSRRDAGITLTKTFWHKKIQLFAGAYSGQGELLMLSSNAGGTAGDGDPNGKLEYVARAEFHYPCEYKYSEVFDTRHVPIPMITVAANGRYQKRESSFDKGTSDFDIKGVAGTRQMIGADVAAQWMGFSFLGEWHGISITPLDTNSPMLAGRQTTYFRAGGIAAQVAYFSKKLKSGLLVRYDELMPNDLFAVDYVMKNLSMCYNYYLSGTKSMLRIQYTKRLTPQTNTRFEPKYRDDLLRVGWQLVF